MTNLEKFREVFGFSYYLKREYSFSCPFPAEICLECGSDYCKECKLYGWWNKEYKPCFRLKEEFEE